MAAAEGHSDKTGDSMLPMKKRKISSNISRDEENGEESTQPQSKSFFENFKLVSVLREDDHHKVMCVHGRLPVIRSEPASDSGASGEADAITSEGDESDAVLVLEKKPFDPAAIEACIRKTKTTETLHNDIYRTFDIVSNLTQPDMKATLVFPATEKHIAKYSEYEPFVVNETPELYKSVTQPCLQASKFSLQWVYNILDKKSEVERIVTEDPDPETGFVMVPDMKWDGQKVEALYLVAIVNDRTLKSLRELRGKHLPLLNNILNKGRSSIKEKYGVNSDKLRVYFHYQPSYYLLHIHFTHIRFDAPGTDVMRAHLLSDTIDNLSIDPEFYAKKSLSYVVKDGDQLYNAYKESGYFNDKH